MGSITILDTVIEAVVVGVSRVIHGPWREVSIGTYMECDDAVHELSRFTTKVREVQEGRWAVYVRARKVDAASQVLAGARGHTSS